MYFGIEYLLINIEFSHAIIMITFSSQYIVTRKVINPKDFIWNESIELTYEINEEIISTSVLKGHSSSKISISRKKIHNLRIMEKK